ncbi:MAG: hypothetical protein U1F76_22375 [Candidatus Competibacteraceae bacterium]
MIITQDQINNLLAILKGLLNLIMPLRQQVSELELGLTQVQRDYECQMSSINAEADRLETLIISLRSRLAGRKAPKVSSDNKPYSKDVPKIQSLPEKSEPIRVEMPPPPPEDPRIKRKRALADHIFYFMDGDQKTLMEEINVALSDSQQDVGNMLERLTWGDIWTVRAAWESLEDQYVRLDGWREALDERRAYWQTRLSGIEGDPNYHLLIKMREMGQEAWLSDLNKLAQDRQADNAKLVQEVALLEQEWAKIQRELSDE